MMDLTSKKGREGTLHLMAECTSIPTLPPGRMAGICPLTVAWGTPYPIHKINRVFLQNRRSWQQYQYWHQRLYYMKIKKSSNKMIPSVSIEPLTSDSKSNTLLSEAIWHVYLGIIKLLFMHHLIFLLG